MTPYFVNLFFIATNRLWKEPGETKSIHIFLTDRQQASRFGRRLLKVLEICLYFSKVLHNILMIDSVEQPNATRAIILQARAMSLYSNRVLMSIESIVKSAKYSPSLAMDGSDS